MKVLMVMTSHEQLGDTGAKTGLWLEEFAAPYYALLDAGVELVLASPRGGQPPIDPSSEQAGALTDATRRFSEDEDAQELLAHTVRLDSVSSGDFDGTFYPGGHGPLWDLATDESSHELLERFISEEKPIAAVCHAPIVLKDLVNADGTSFLRGRRVTGFSDAEETMAGLAEVVPELLEDALVSRGAIYSKADVDFASHVVVDGLLVTGQNPASSGPAAEALIKTLHQSTSDARSQGVAQ